jgi:uncharacterized protein YjbJ (UPF0337 family)
MGLFDDIKFKAEELLGTVDASDLQKHLGELQDKLKEKADSLTPDQVDDLKGKISELKEKYAGQFGDLFDSVSDAVSGAAEKAGDAASSAVDSATDAASSAVDSASDALGNVADKLTGKD